mmetsp:Transcript_21201/g.41454  ORF Transcript_21201/g.41454 Transcript_21201/m.41454 type:complete len:201 (-) Transcript_21201:978-1580(-)
MTPRNMQLVLLASLTIWISHWWWWMTTVSGKACPMQFLHLTYPIFTLRSRLLGSQRVGRPCASQRASSLGWIRRCMCIRDALGSTVLPRAATGACLSCKSTQQSTLVTLGVLRLIGGGTWWALHPRACPTSRTWDMSFPPASLRCLLPSLRAQASGQVSASLASLADRWRARPCGSFSRWAMKRVCSLQAWLQWVLFMKK